MSRLAELRAKYGLEGGKYEPKPDCKFCGGTGERKLRHRDGGMFCICLFIEPSLSDFAGETLAATAKMLREEMDGARITSD